MSFSPDGKHIAFGDGSSDLEWAVLTVEGNEVYKGRIEAMTQFGKNHFLFSLLTKLNKCRQKQLSKLHLPFFLNGAWPPVQEGFARSKTGLYWMQNDQLLVLTPNQGGLHDVEVWDLPQINKFCMFRGHKIKFGGIKQCKFG